MVDDAPTDVPAQRFDVASLAARAEIMHVLTRHVRAVDRMDWDLWRQGFHDDATQAHGDFEAANGEFCLSLQAALPAAA